MAYFTQYQKASKDSELRRRGNSYLGLRQFYEDAKNGDLPEISIIVGPAELAEHMPYLPSDGAWLQKQVVDAVTHSPKYHETALIISYDGKLISTSHYLIIALTNLKEVGGYGDHVVPFMSPKGTPGEWIDDPYNLVGHTAIGPGYRLPFYIISPWTRGSHVFTEHADHNSQNMFIEHWLEAKGYENIRSKEMSPWRRAHMSNLLNAFDFDHPDLSLPNITASETPLTWSRPKVRPDGPLGSMSDNYIGAAMCQARHKTAHPPVPYGKENAEADPSKLVEEGFRQVRGALTEGRYLVFESNGLALSNTGGKEGNLTSSNATARHEVIEQRWILNLVAETGTHEFFIRSALDNSYITHNKTLTPEKENAEIFTITDLGNGKGYRILGLGVSNTTQDTDREKELRKGFNPGKTLIVGEGGGVEFLDGEGKGWDGGKGWKIFSVTYHE